MNFPSFWKQSSHSFCRKTAITFQFFYNSIMTFMSWFLLGNFYLAFFILIRGALIEDAPQAVVGFQMVYSALILMQLVLALGNRPEKVKSLYSLCATILGLMMLGTFFLSIKFAFASTVLIKVAAICSIGLFFVSALMHGEFFHVVISFFQYIIMLPSFVNIFMVYAFCNTHDLSWGTKGIEAAHGVAAVAGGKAGGGRRLSVTSAKQVMLQRQAEEREAKEKRAKDGQNRDRLEEFRSNVLMFWLACNGALVGVVVSTYNCSGGTRLAGDQMDLYFMNFIFYSCMGFNGIRFIGSMIFILQRCYPTWSANREQKKKGKMQLTKGEPLVLGNTASAQNLTNPLSTGAAHGSAPVGSAAEVPLTKLAEEAGWSVAFDSGSGRSYYQNHETGEVAWSLPDHLK